MRRMLVVDAGSTNYTKRVVFEDGRMEAVENELGEMTTPASILIGKEDGKEYIFIGRNAKDQSVITPENYFCSWKREMGSEKVIRSIAGKDYTPVTLTAIMLKQMKKEAEEYCGCELSEILITMPVEYSETQKKALVDAAVIAGFEKDKVHIRLESDAAVRSADARNDFRGTIACLDCGGTTLDCTVCEVANDEIRALFTKGDLNFAGKEFDICMAGLVKKIITKKIEESQVDEQKKKELMKALNSLDKFSQQDLMLKSEKAKEDLSKKQKTSFSFCFAKGPEGTVNVQIEQKQYEEECENVLMPHFRTFLSELKKALEEKNLQVTSLVLTGGSFHIPMLKKAVEDAFPESDIRLKNPEFSICEGAAMMAAEILGADKKGEDEQHIGVSKTFIPVCNRSYGIEAYTLCKDENGKNMEKLMISTMLERNSTLPAVFEREYYTRVDNQKAVAINVYESNVHDELEKDGNLELSKGTMIAQATLNVQKDLPKNSPIKVTMHLDENYNLHVEAQEETGHTSVETTVKVTSAMSEEEIEKKKQIVDDILDEKAS